MDSISFQEWVLSILVGNNNPEQIIYESAGGSAKLPLDKGSLYMLNLCHMIKTAQALKAYRSQKGFTLIELLVVIGILAVLLAITLIAINPGRQFAQANNTARSSDVNSILNAVGQYLADNKGVLPPGIAAGDADKPIGSAVGGTGEAFCTALVSRYIAALPHDPLPAYTYTDCTTYTTGYTVSVSTPGAGDTPRVTIKAPQTELGIPVISVTR